MALYDKNGWYNNLFGDANIFGASPSNTDALVTAGLISQEDIDKAQKQSLMRGLLGTAVSYIAQPKNQGYGSALPYLGKAFMSGMDQAGKPFQDLTSKANMQMKMDAYKRQQDAYAREDKARENLSKFKQGLYDNNAEVVDINQTLDPRVYEADAQGNITQIAPNFNPITETRRGAWDANKYLRDALANDTITIDQYNKYKEILAPTTTPVALAEGAMLVDPITNEVLVENVKNVDEYETLTPQTYETITGNKAEKGAVYQRNKKTNEISKVNSGQTINVNTGTQKANDDLWAEAQVTGNAAAGKLNQLQQFQNYITQMENAGMDTGKFTSAKADLIKFADKLGFPIDPRTLEGVGAAEAARALTNQLALQLRPKASGPMTDKDFETFLQSVPSINNTKVANKLMLDFARDSAERQEQLADKLLEYKMANKDVYGRPKEPGTVGDDIWIITRQFWRDVREERAEKFNLENYQGLGEPEVIG